MELIFWGTRGSLPMNTPAHRIFGGNTSCVSVHAGEHSVIFDAGSGLIHLGSKMAEQEVREVDICFSHFHSDHICGVPFFKPFFDPDCTVRLHSFGVAEATLYDALTSYLSRPIFPISIDDFQAKIEFIHHPDGAGAQLGGLQISALEIPHPGGAHALKAQADGKTFVYATDTEHTIGEANQSLIAFMRDADMTVYDCTFDDSEFEHRQGWGHSTWQEGLRLAQAAQVKKFGIFHHEPERSDEALMEIEKQAQHQLPQSLVTRDFMHLKI
ncbi:MAG: MBL fold metallo-hydrolase [Rhodobiaceae bacterium]|jgi:phosphoribosyl 1,2-cyclic phosphodiesterase|nr:MBL fold metallo-hydrolase [Rhodobiaceae bacterium]MBT5517537.1 MBL fold metallo-hydrolase [Rhodobiaceae bacterium]MDG2495881.1 MBL fold metallo-hydrolase [Alphaproteobacteria bacterium]